MAVAAFDVGTAQTFRYQQFSRMLAGKSRHFTQSFSVIMTGAASAIIRSEGKKE